MWVDSSGKGFVSLAKTLSLFIFKVILSPLLPFPVFHFFCVAGAVSSMPTKVEPRTFSVVPSFAFPQSNRIDGMWSIRFPTTGRRIAHTPSHLTSLTFVHRGLFARTVRVGCVVARYRYSYQYNSPAHRYLVTDPCFGTQ